MGESAFSMHCCSSATAVVGGLGDNPEKVETNGLPSVIDKDNTRVLFSVAFIMFVTPTLNTLVLLFMLLPAD